VIAETGTPYTSPDPQRSAYPSSCKDNGFSEFFGTATAFAVDGHAYVARACNVDADIVGIDDSCLPGEGGAGGSHTGGTGGAAGSANGGAGAALPPGSAGDEGGCGCRMAAGSHGSAGALFAVALAIATARHNLAARRRRQGLLVRAAPPSRSHAARTVTCVG
jgi:hypothetical protein